MRTQQVAHRARYTAYSLAALILGGACSQEAQAPPVRNLDRPTDIAFACYGDLRVDGQVQSSAQPIASCQAHDAGEPPEGQEGITNTEYFGFVLQPSRGTMAVLNVAALGVQDNDPLTPGMNDIPVGALPVGISADESGCFMMTANSASCDLALVDVSSALDVTRPTIVNRLPLTSPGGTPILSKPRSLAASPQRQEVGEACPEAATGLVYLSFPECHLVAAIDPATGKAAGGIVFADDGTVSLATEEDYDCPVQCGDGTVGTALATGGFGSEAETFDERPVTMEMSKEGDRLYIAGESSPFLTVVDLDEDFLPTSEMRRIRLEGEVGVTGFAVTDLIDMGGDERSFTEQPSDPVGEFRFAYAIATDATIRVVDVENGVECDTQVDPRLIHDETDVAFLSCMPVGDARTPRRRANAISPGIHLPGRRRQGRFGLQDLAVPLDVEFATIEARDDNIAANSDPNIRIGTFAYVTAADGLIYVVNVDDDHYGDTEVPDDPIAISMPLALAHQLRDSGATRNAVAPSCSSVSPSFLQDGARLMSAPQQIIDTNQISFGRVHELPFLRGLLCDDSEEGGGLSVVGELNFAADTAERELAWPDLRAVENEQMSLVWEGGVSGDLSDVYIDGPPVRKGIGDRDAGKAFLRDASEPFCALGIQEFDIAALVGCDPLRGNAQCGVGEECFVHPDTPAVINNGICLAVDKVDGLTEPCRDFAISRRQYSVKNPKSQQVELIERRRVLRTTPLDGCESAAQCVTLAELEQQLESDLHPIDFVPEEVAEGTWVCEPDPSRAGEHDRCIMACASQADCEDGFHCLEEAGHCVEAPLPPRECLQSVQRYSMRVGEGFALLGADTGFLHRIERNPETGACEESPSSHPLNVGRIPLRPEPCDDDNDPLTGPNPCRTTIDHSEQFVNFALEEGVCVAQDQAVRTFDMPAVRVSTPSMRFHLVGTESTGDKDCLHDQEGEFPPFSAVFSGYQMLLDVGGGFTPQTVPNTESALPISVVKDPQGRLWVIDQGDANVASRGILFRVDPESLERGVVF